MKKFTKFILIAFLIVVLDQLTKFIVVNNFDYIQNTGAGFGLFQGNVHILIWISVIVIGLIFYFFDTIPDIKYVFYSVAFILGGTLGNLIDRIRLGYVIDFIDLGFWPAFNLADSAITIGVVGLIYYLIKK